MPDIALSTLNAKYIHASFGLRYLMANLGELRNRAVLLEFDINQRPLEIAERLIQCRPRILGLGVYIWNVVETERLIRLLKQIAPETIVILGGPEVSFPEDFPSLVQHADHVVTGEADEEFQKLCRRILSNDPPADKICRSNTPDVQQLDLPYSLYTEEDLAHRIIYVEASRGCPFTCEFCLSSLDIPVRQFDLNRLLQELDGLLKRGATQFKFVDRTFNLNLKNSRAVLEFFLERYFPGLFLHFEMIPDRLPEGLREIIARFPAGALQFEVGIQTFNPEVSARISRRQNYERLADNFAFLTQHTGVHIHADLIAGLPGESLESFGEGFDRLTALKPHEIQVGILKRLRGTPIVRHDEEWRMIYGQEPPYEILQNRLISFEDMQRIRRFARYWDLAGNSGNFVNAAPMIWESQGSPFRSFLDFSDWLYAQSRRTHGIALKKLLNYLFEYLTDIRRMDAAIVAEALMKDYTRSGRSDVPPVLRPYLEGRPRTSNAMSDGPAAPQKTPKRQRRHLAQP